MPVNRFSVMEVPDQGVPGKRGLNCARIGDERQDPAYPVKEHINSGRRHLGFTNIGKERDRLLHAEMSP